MSELEIYRPRQLSRWQRMRDSLRSFTLGPYNIKDKELARHFGGRSVSSGVVVSEDSAMNYAAVFAAVDIISASISSVPLVLFKKNPNGGKDRFESHPLYRIIHERPNPQMGSSVFRKTLQAHKLLWGNGYAEIERDEAGRPKFLWPLQPYAMKPFYQGGRLRYRYTNQSGDDINFDAADVLHIRGLADSGIEGRSVIARARESLGLGIAAERFGGAFFGNGSTMGGVISYPAGAATTPQTRKENREALESRHEGVDRAYRLLATYEGATYTQMGVPPNEAQFLETRQFQIEEVARWFRIPQKKLRHYSGGASSYNSTEAENIEYVTDTLNPDWVTWEQELQLKLVAPLEQGIQTIEHVREGMLQGDSVARSALQSTQFHIGAVTPNEVRAMENRNPYDGGEKPFVSLQLIPMDLARPYWEAQIDKAKEPKVVAPPKPEADPKQEEEVKTARALAQAAEDAKDIAIENARRADERCVIYEADLAESIERHAQEVAQLGDALAQANTSLHDAASREQALIEEREALKLTVAERGDEVFATDALLQASRAALDDLRVGYDIEASARIQSVQNELAATKERDAALALQEVIRTERDAALTNGGLLAMQTEAEIEQLKAGRDKAWQAHQAAIDAGVVFVAERDEALALADEAAKERDAARAEVSVLHQNVKAQIDCLDASREDTRMVRSDLERVSQEYVSVGAEAESLRADLARARADIATELDTQQKQRAVLLAAMRSLFVDASERLLQKESDRARKHQATAEKLRAWVETFYPMHSETVRAAFRPLVGAWTAITGGGPDALLERLVSEHMDTSRQALELVLDADDEDLRAATLERTLRRWEDERAEAMADALVREGIGQ
jgi:HK97 family phage portal protein